MSSSTLRSFIFQLKKNLNSEEEEAGVGAEKEEGAGEEERKSASVFTSKFIF